MNHMKVVVVIMRRLDSLAPFLQQRQGILCLEGIGRRETLQPRSNLERTIEVCLHADGEIRWFCRMAIRIGAELDCGCEINRTQVRQCDVRRNPNFI